MNEENHENTKGRKRERRNLAYKGRNPGKLGTEANEGNKGKVSAIAINQSDRFATLFVSFVTFCSTFSDCWQNENRKGQAVVFRVFVIRLGEDLPTGSMVHSSGFA